MFSEILGLAGSALGAFSSMNAANQQYSLGVANMQMQWQLAQEQMAMQRRALNQQEDMANMSWGMAQDQLRREREQERFVRETDEANRRMLGEEFNLRLGSQRDRSRQAQLERNAMLERQVRLDRDAARTQAFGLEQYLRNQNISADERQYAQSLLENARRTASGEADNDLRRFAEERMMAQDERNFAIEQLQNTQAVAMRERADDAGVRDMMIRRAGGLQSALDAALRGMGDMQDIPRLSREDIQAEVMRREDRAVEDADSAIDRVASINEADLIRRGLDASSPGLARRGDIAEQASDLYARARDQARDSALRFITGQQGALTENFNSDLRRRQAVLGEQGAVAGAGLDVLARLPQLRSANDYRAPVDVRTGIFSRQLRSANDWRAPVDMGTARFESNSGFMPGMGSTLNLPSAAGAMELNPGSRLLAAPNWNITNPSAFSGQAMSGMQGVASAYGQGAALQANLMGPMSTPFFNRADSAAAGAGASFQQMMRSLGGMGDRLVSNGFFGSPQTYMGGYTQSHMGGIPLPPDRPTSFSNFWDGV